MPSAIAKRKNLKSEAIKLIRQLPRSSTWDDLMYRIYVRQTIEATTFDDEGAEFEITISGGVVEASPNESSAAIYRRAQQALLFAKKAGRNRCAIDEGQGPTTVTPPQLAVQGRVVNLSRE